MQAWADHLERMLRAQADDEHGSRYEDHEGVMANARSAAIAIGQARGDCALLNFVLTH